VIKLNHELERIADFYKQTVFNPDTGFAHIQNLARRRESPALQTATPTHLDARGFSLEPHVSGLRLSIAYARGPTTQNEVAKATAVAQ
jgi:hypothetical protein